MSRFKKGTNRNSVILKITFRKNKMKIYLLKDHESIEKIKF